MIIPDNPKKYDESIKFLYYEKNEKGNFEQKLEQPSSERDDQLIDLYYKTRFDELIRLINEVIEGKISPIKLYIDSQCMDISDVANRMKISLSKLKKHMTFEGFKKIDISTLQKYAKIFGISIVDFFQFIELKDNLNIKFEEKNYNEKIIQKLIISKKI